MYFMLLDYINYNIDSNIKKLYKLFVKVYPDQNKNNTILLTVKVYTNKYKTNRKLKTDWT